MNKPATKLATKGTLVTIATIPKGATMFSTFDMFVIIDSMLISIVPVYTKAITANAIIPTATAMPAILFRIVPAK